MTARRSFVRRFQPGFALVTTLVMMVLLVLLALGLLSLSSISLRSGSQESERMTARSNARCALMLAIAQLQKQMGPDQRISAPATLGAEAPPADHEMWVGAWRSATTTATKFPKGRKPDFAGWLVSSPDERALESVASETAASALMERLSDGRQTRVPMIKSATGNLAWWTSDEAQKATLDLAAPAVTTDAGHVTSRHAPPRLSPETIESVGSFPQDEATTKKILTPEQVELVVAEKPVDLTRFGTTGARSLMTDVRKRGCSTDHPREPAAPAAGGALHPSSGRGARSHRRGSL